MSNQDKHLVQALRDVQVRPDGTRVFSAELRQRAVAWYRAKRAQGVACRTIGDTLGIHPVLLASWARREQTQGFRQIEVLGGASPSALKPVAQVETVASQQTPHAAQDSAPKSGLTLISPRGWRLEGLEPGWLPQLIEALS